jgi:pimeloyl-[acyl-carrier protein] methyl ester esterase
VVKGLLGDIFSEGLDQSARAEFYAESFQTPTETAAKMLMLVAQADLRSILPAIDCPVLVVNGARSVVPPGVGAWMVQQLPDGRAVILDRAGHAPFWDADIAFNSAIETFHTD